jgi:hypothetical protein
MAVRSFFMCSSSPALRKGMGSIIQTSRLWNWDFVNGVEEEDILSTLHKFSELSALCHSLFTKWVMPSYRDHVKYVLKHILLYSDFPSWKTSFLEFVGMLLACLHW